MSPAISQRVRAADLPSAVAVASRGAARGCSGAERATARPGAKPIGANPPYGQIAARSARGSPGRRRDIAHSTLGRQVEAWVPP